MRKVALAAAVLAAGVVLLTAGVVWRAIHAPLPDHHRDYRVAGLDGAVEIVRDEWGEAAGRFPVRAEGKDGSRPQQGWTSADAWQGFLSYELMPWVKNPDTGVIASGNNPSVPAAWFERVRAVVGGGEPDFLKDAS